MSTQLNQTNKQFVKERVKAKFIALMHKCAMNEKKELQAALAGNCDYDEFGDKILPRPLTEQEELKLVVPQLHAYFNQVRDHWARKNKLDYKATWNHMQSIYACEYVENKYSEYLHK